MFVGYVRLAGLAAVTAACAGAAIATENPDRVSPEVARAAFARLKQLAGNWRGKSTKGWTEKVEYTTIAGGSVLMATSYGAHPNEWMATMFHMDGDRLLLTHYCIARNQPRLQATQVSRDLIIITFEFLDATNLKSRDQGHMDKVVFRMKGPDAFSSRWTWYQDGRESWMEEIEHRRPAAGRARVAGKAAGERLKPQRSGGRPAPRPTRASPDQ